VVDGLLAAVRIGREQVYLQPVGQRQHAASRALDQAPFDRQRAADIRDQVLEADHPASGDIELDQGSQPAGNRGDYSIGGL